MNVGAAARAGARVVSYSLKFQWGVWTATERTQGNDFPTWTYSNADMGEVLTQIEYRTGVPHEIPLVPAT